MIRISKVRRRNRLLLIQWNSEEYCLLLDIFKDSVMHSTHAQMPTLKRFFPRQNLLGQDKCRTCNCARPLISPYWLIMLLWKPCAHYASLYCLYCTAWLIIFQENQEGLMLSLFLKGVLAMGKANCSTINTSTIKNSFKNAGTYMCGFLTYLHS